MGSSGVTSYADSDWISASLGGLRSAKLSPLSRAVGGSIGVTSYAEIPTRLRYSWGAANCETVATFEGCWRVQRGDVLRRLILNLAMPGGGLRSAKLSPLSRAALGPSGVTFYASSD